MNELERVKCEQARRGSWGLSGGSAWWQCSWSCCRWRLLTWQGTTSPLSGTQRMGSSAVRPWSESGTGTGEDPQGGGDPHGGEDPQGAHSPLPLHPSALPPPPALALAREGVAPPPPAAAAAYRQKSRGAPPRSCLWLPYPGPCVPLRCSGQAGRKNMIRHPSVKQGELLLLLLLGPCQLLQCFWPTQARGPGGQLQHACAFWSLGQPLRAHGPA